MKPRIFVGMMFCGEEDFTHACSAIGYQHDVDVQLTVIMNQPEKAAHNRLWDAWRAAQHSGFDMFVKIDADTVLYNSKILSRLWGLMSSNPRITGIQAPLDDYYTDDFINGLNCFSPRVTFQDTTNDLFCDRHIDVGHDIVIKADQCPPELRPAGYHCHYASRVQAFHYGVHRTLKGQADIIAKVRKAWEKEASLDGDDYTYDTPRSFVLLGSMMANRFLAGGFNYTDPGLLDAFDEAHRTRMELLKP